MNREAEIKCDSTQVCRIVIDNLLDWNRTFTYRNEDKHIIAFISEDDFDGLSLLCDVEFIEPSQEELDELEEKVTEFFKKVRFEYEYYSFTTNWDVEVCDTDMYGDEVRKWANIDGFDLNSDDELILVDNNNDCEYNIDEIIDKAKRKEILLDIVKELE